MSTQSSLRVLFVGNSYTSRNDLPRMIAELASTAEPSVQVETAMIFAGGASLRRHWNAGRAQQALEAGAWDWVVLQEQSTLPVKNRARYHDNVRMFEAAIRARGARTALYLVWTRRASPEAQDLLDAAADEIAAELGAFVVPVGPAWQIALRADPALTLYADDGSHPTVAGTYLAACTFAAHLIGVTVSGFAVSDRLKLDREVAVRLHAAAAEAVRRGAGVQSTP